MIVGQSVDRQDGRAKVLGKAKYAAEFQMDGLVHAVLVQSTIAAGTITGIEVSRARGMPGVLEILTADNADKLDLQHAAQQTVHFPLLQGKEILYNGQHVAVVVANTLQQAQAAAAKIVVRYKPAEAAILMESVLNQAYKPKQFNNGRSEADTKTGDPDAAMNNAAEKVEATYVTPIEHHNPMEPHATIASWDGDQLTVWTSTQGISARRPLWPACLVCPRKT
jgi:xanthine dehydrogenase YagR molybdenum-binding subunit